MSVQQKLEAVSHAAKYAYHIGVNRANRDNALSRARIESDVWRKHWVHIARAYHATMMGWIIILREQR